jgi:hypothetical protein
MINLNRERERERWEKGRKSSAHSLPIPIFLIIYKIIDIKKK